MSEKSQWIYSMALWSSTLAILVLLSVQALSGNWVTYFLILPGGPADLSQRFLVAVTNLATFHKMMGFIIGGVSVLILTFAFLHRSSIYVRIFTVIGFIIIVSAGIGGYLFVKSEFQDRWALGQMSDSFVGAYAAYFLQLFFMNKTPRFVWTSKERSRNTS
jgi:hypothetical protein